MNTLDDLQVILTILLDIPGWYQPPETSEMEYPCFVFQLDKAAAKYADNSIYQYMKRYKVTVIDREPDSVIPDKMLSLPYCSFDRFYTASNLNHWVYILYF